LFRWFLVVVGGLFVLTPAFRCSWFCLLCVAFLGWFVSFTFVSVYRFVTFAVVTLGQDGCVLFLWLVYVVRSVPVWLPLAFTFGFTVCCVWTSSTLVRSVLGLDSLFSSFGSYVLGSIVGWLFLWFWFGSSWVVLFGLFFVLVCLVLGCVRFVLWFWFCGFLVWWFFSSWFRLG